MRVHIPRASPRAAPSLVAPPRPDRPLASARCASTPSVRRGASTSESRASRARARPRDELDAAPRVVLGFGSAGLDVIARLDVPGFIEPDGKYRASELRACGGGNAANGSTSASRLGARCYLVTKLGLDGNGRSIADELERDGVRTKHVVWGGEKSPFTYILVTRSTGGDASRACVHTPGDALREEEMTPSRANAILDDVRPNVVYFDGRLTEGAIVMAREARRRPGTRLLVEAERLRENLDQLLAHADVVCTSKTYPRDRFPECASLGDAMLRVMGTLAPSADVMVTTLGARGSVGLVRERGDAMPDVAESLDAVLERLERSANERASANEDELPGESVESEAFVALDSSGKRAFALRAIFAPAQRLKNEQIVDTTGAGDAFIGTMAMAACSEDFNVAETMRLGSFVAAAKCQGFGARSALPRGEDIPPTLAAPLRAPTRRAAMLSVIFGGLLSLFTRDEASAATSDSKELTELFNRAMQASTYEESEAAWTRAIEITEPASRARSAALSNRGTLRLQYSDWTGAVADLQASVDGDGNNPDPLALNNLGNALGALGRWDEAMSAYLEASRTEDMREIALANYALAAFQIKKEDLAMSTLRKVLRRDPEFLDARAALSAFLWATGDFDAAEAEWTFLCKSGRGFGAQRSAEEKRDAGALAYGFELFTQSAAQIVAELDGGVKEAGLDTPCRLYKTTDVVANRWPPRCTAALDAFLRVRRDGQALDYDGEVKTFDFN